MGKFWTGILEMQVSNRALGTACIMGLALALPPASSTYQLWDLSKLLSVSMPHFPHLLNGHDNNNTGL